MSFKKKFLAIMLAFSVSTTSIVYPIATSFAESNSTYSVQSTVAEYVQIAKVKKVVKLRTKANSSSKVITSLKVDTRVETIGRIGSYYKIKYKGSYGYAHYSYFTLESGTQLGIVNKTVKLRTKASSTDYKVIKSLSKGTRVEIAGKRDGYYKVKYNDGYAYVSPSYVDINTETYTVTKNVYLREQANKSSKKIKLLKAGQEIESIETLKYYYRLKYNNQYVYASKSCFELNTENFKVVTNVYLREEPNKSSKKIKLIKVDEEVEVLGTAGSSYYAIKYNGGCVYATKTCFELKLVPKVVIQNVYLRAQANTISTKIKLLKVGEEVQVAKEIGDFYKIRYNDGYVYAKKDCFENKPTAYKVIKNVNLRTEPNTTTSQSIKLLYSGEIVDVVDMVGNYYKIKYEGGYGYAYNTNFELYDGTIAEPELTKYVVLQNVNLRTEPNSTTSQAIKLLYAGEVVEVETMIGNYYKIKYEGGYGYAYNTYFELYDENAVIPDPVPVEKEGLVNDGRNIYYQNLDGTLYKGYKVVDGVPYYFDLDTGYSTYKLVFLDEVENGETITNKYYVNKTGGFLKNGFKTFSSGNMYYFDSTGKACRGLQTINGNNYYFNPNTCEAKKGLMSIKDKVCYFNTDTYIMEKNTMIVVAGKIDVYLDENGMSYKMICKDDSKLASMMMVALSKLGTPYSDDPAIGFDCIAFVYYILNTTETNIFDKTLYTPRQLAHGCIDQNVVVDLTALEPGDIILYNNETCDEITSTGYCTEAEANGMHIHHVAMYIGDGKVIECSASSYKNYDHSGVRIVDLNINREGRTYYPYLAARVANDLAVGGEWTPGWH